MDLCLYLGYLLILFGPLFILRLFGPLFIFRLSVGLPPLLLFGIGECVMTMKNDAKFEKELTCCFKIDMRNLTNFELSTQKSQKFALKWAPFEQSI